MARSPLHLILLFVWLLVLLMDGVYASDGDADPIYNLTTDELVIGKFLNIKDVNLGWLEFKTSSFSAAFGQCVRSNKERKPGCLGVLPWRID
ncbi:hypothetical protein DKX38_023171 [Salix brachista]|uniref:Transmembrane protein n=1 Tax=Salix brachista TaxID=2182728 RepID=A0A5N5K256_9ROSI|nr:hypothetical protein DKX38_023171 [Salix brachista]